MVMLALTANNTLAAVVTGGGAAAAAAGAAITASRIHGTPHFTGDWLLCCIYLLCLFLAAIISVLTIGCWLVEGVSELRYKLKVWRDCRRIEMHHKQYHTKKS